MAEPAPKPALNLRDIFNAAVGEAHAAFPGLKGKFAVLNLPDMTIHGSMTEEGTQLGSKKEIEDFVTLAAANSKKLNSSIAKRQAEARVIVYNPTAHSERLFTTQAQPKEMAVYAEFDHELGHLLIADALKNATLSESLYSEAAADTYAVIRNIQRFGDKAAGASVVSWQRAVSFIERGSQSHFTSFTLDEFAKVQEKIDFKALTPDESLHLARRFALEHTPHESLMRSLMTAFQPYRDALKANPADRVDALKVLAEIALGDDTGYYTFKLGAKMLEPYLKGNVTIGGQRLKLEGPYWDAKRRAFALRSLQVEKEDILAGFPLKNKTPANNNGFTSLKPADAPPTPAPKPEEGVIKKITKWF